MRTERDAPGNLSLDGRVAVVTGAGAGLGRAEALALADAGARVVLNDLPGAADDAADEIRALGVEVAIVEGDVGERSTADAMLAAAVDGFGSLDIVVNNAGMTRDRMLFNLSDEEWDDVIRVHLRGPLPALAQRGGVLADQVEGGRRTGLRRGSSTPPPRRSSAARPARPTTPPPRPASPP